MTIKVPILPNPSDPMLTKRVTGVDQNGVLQELPVVEERTSVNPKSMNFS